MSWMGRSLNFLRADATVPYGRVVEIMGAAHEAGLQRIGFVAEPAQASAR